MRHGTPPIGAHPGLRVFALALAVALAGCGASVLPSVHSETERFSVAQQTAARGDYADAIGLLKTYVANNAGSADVDNAIYLLGECYLKTKSWTLAAAEFERLMRDFPESDSCPSASFRLGEAYFGQSRGPDFDQEYTERAEGQWQSYLRAFPGHWLNDEGRHRVAIAHVRLATRLVRTGNLYLKMRQLTPARIYYERIERDYPDTPQLADAWVGLALIDSREGHRDGAIERLKMVESRFPGRPAADRAARERARLQR